MTAAEYKRVIALAHDVRIKARNIASYEPLDAALERARATAHGRRAGHVELLLAVRELSRAARSTKTLAGAEAAPEPVQDDPGSLHDLCAPAPARNVSMGAGSAPEPEPAPLGARAGGSRRGSHASAPVETVAFKGAPARRRRGPAAS